MSLIKSIFGADFGEEQVRVETDFCSDGGHHDEEVLDKTILPSAYEQMDDWTKKEIFQSEGYEDEKFRKILVIMLKCKKCGRVAKITESNP